MDIIPKGQSGSVPDMMRLHKLILGFLSSVRFVPVGQIRTGL